MSAGPLAVPVVNTGWRHVANQSHVAPVGTSLSEVWRKNFAQLERETEGEKELGSSEEERDRNQKSRKQISSRFSLFFFFLTGRVFVGGVARWTRSGKQRTRFQGTVHFLKLAWDWVLRLVDVKSGRRFNTEPEECIQLGQRRVSVSGDVQPARSGSSCSSKVSWTWAPLVSLNPLPSLGSSPVSLLASLTPRVHPKHASIQRCNLSTLTKTLRRDIWACGWSTWCCPYWDFIALLKTIKSPVVALMCGINMF